jgi:hypothetical protein
MRPLFTAACTAGLITALSPPALANYSGPRVEEEPEVAAVYDPGNAEVHVFGIGQGGSMWTSTCALKLSIYGPAQPFCAQPANWQNLGGVFISSPAAVVRAQGLVVDVFGLGTDSQMFHKSFDSQSGWSGRATIPRRCPRTRSPMSSRSRRPSRALPSRPPARPNGNPPPHAAAVYGPR